MIYVIIPPTLIPFAACCKVTMTGMLDFVVQYCLFCYWKSIDIDDTILCCCIFNHFTFYTFHISLEWWHTVHSNAQYAHGPQYLCVGVFYSYPPEDTGTKATTQLPQRNPDSKVRGANMGSIWGRQDPGGPMLAAGTLLSGKTPSLPLKYKYGCLT